MADERNEVKDGAAAAESVPVVEVQRRLSELMNRAAFGGERIVLTRNGKALAAVIGLRDLAMLDAMQAARS